MFSSLLQKKNRGQSGGSQEQPAGGVLTGYLSALGQKIQNIKKESVSTHLASLDSSFQSIVQRSGISELTSMTYAAGAEYVKAYEAASSSLELEASKDDYNKLILLMQKANPHQTETEEARSPNQLGEQPDLAQIDCSGGQPLHLPEEAKKEEPPVVMPSSAAEDSERGQGDSLFFCEDTESITKRIRGMKEEPVRQMEHVFLVGFHHLVGSQVEFIYPPLEDGDNISPELLLKISAMALPDGSHLH